MSLVEVDVGPVLLLERHNFRQRTDGAFHRVDPLHQDQDLLPRPPERVNRTITFHR